MEFIKLLYKFKIRLMFYFNLGWNELATPIAVVRDIAIILTFIKIVFGVTFGYWVDALICLVCFAGFILLGWVLKRSGMSDFTNRINNSVNPQLMLVEKIYKHLNIKE